MSPSSNSKPPPPKPVAPKPAAAVAAARPAAPKPAAVPAKPAAPKPVAKAAPPPAPLPPPVADDGDLDELDALDRLSPYEGAVPEGTVVAPIPVSLDEEDEVRVITREGGAMMAGTQVGPLPDGVHGSIEFDDASGPPFRVAKTVVVIGRVASAADLVLPWNEEASRQHCAILFSDGGFFLEDLQSSNGTYLNDEPVERVRLCSGDKIRIGTQVLVFRFKA